MKSEKEIRELIEKFIELAVECHSQADEEMYLEKAHLLGWVVGLNSITIDAKFEKLMEETYGVMNNV